MKHSIYIFHPSLQEPYNTKIIFIIFLLKKRTKNLSLRKIQILAKGYRAKIELDFRSNWNSWSLPTSHLGVSLSQIVFLLLVTTVPWPAISSTGLYSLLIEQFSGLWARCYFYALTVFWSTFYILEISQPHHHQQQQQIKTKTKNKNHSSSFL